MSFIAFSEAYYSYQKEAPVIKKSANVQSHDWIYDREDLCEIMSNFTDENKAIARLGEMGGIQGICFSLRTDSTKGIDEDEVRDEEAFALRQQLYGRNALTRKPLTPYYLLVWDALEDTTLRVLILCGVISIVIGVVENPHGAEWIDGFAVLIAVLLVTLVTSLNNYSKEKQFREMELESSKKDTLVIRAGNEVQIPTEEVIVGDLVILRQGFAIPCDGIFVLGTENLRTDESALTGESHEIQKNHNHPLLLKGTHVTSGDGLMIAIAVGDYTEWGKLLARLQDDPEDTPLQEKLEKIGKDIGWIGTGVAFLLLIILIIVWAINGHKHPPASQAIISFIIVSVTIIVVAVPEGLPLAVTIALAYSMKKMLKDNNFVRQLAACETMGNVTTICSDKTGTLTQNKMSITQIFLCNTPYYQKLPTKEDLDSKVYRLIINGIVINSKAFEQKPKTDKERDLIAEGKLKPTLVGGNQTECAILLWAIQLGAQNYKQIREENPVTKFFPFDSSVKRSSVMLKNKETNEYIIYTKGAAEQILELCSFYIDNTGNIIKLEQQHISNYLISMKTMTSHGLRCVATCYRTYNKEEIPFEKDGKTLNENNCNILFKDMILLFACGIQDPLRPEVPDAVLTCQNAGIIVRMVTGDHLETAKNIARQCHILTSKDHICMEGKDFALLSQEEKAKKLPNLRVLARSRPSDKEELVTWYKENGHVVAVTGDGANDALALKKANIGLAMGIQGTDIAKEAAHVIIMDDNFASIEKTVMWGRNVYDNIRKFVEFQLTINIVALTISLIAAFRPSFQNPLTAVQLLWVNLIMDTFAALALATEPPSRKLLERLPYAKDCPLISKTMWRFIIGHATWQLFVLLMTMYKAEGWLHLSSRYVNKQTNQNKLLLTIIFNTFVFLQIFNEFNARRCNNEWNVFSGVFDNIYFVAILGITIVGQIIIVEFGGTFTSTHHLDLAQWGYCILVGATSLIVNQIIRLIPVNLHDGMITIDKSIFKNDLDETTNPQNVIPMNAVNDI